VVDGKDYIVANANANLLTRPLHGAGPWQKAEQAEGAPGSSRGLSVVTRAANSGRHGGPTGPLDTPPRTPWILSG
jgi:hypothetical protein